MTDQFETLQQAAEWFVQLQDDDCCEQTRQAWQHWLEADPEHQTAWYRVEDIQASLGFVTGHTQRRQAVSALRSHRQQAVGRRSFVRSLAWLVGAAGLGYLGWRHPQLRSTVLALNADVKTATGEILQRALPDGGTLWLDTASALNMNFTSTIRQLELISGEVLITTGKDAQRRFIVNVPAGQLEALGTRFGIQLGQDQVALQVHEGRVAIKTNAGREAVIDAGQQVLFDRHDIGHIQPLNPDAASWIDRILLADDTRLADLVAQLSRYHRGYLGVAPEVADLRVTGTFPLENVDQALAILSHTLPISVRRLTDWWVTLERR